MMSTSYRRYSLLGFAILAGCAGQAAVVAPPAEVARVTPAGATSLEISAGDFQRRIGIIADDSMKGRDTGSPGHAAAARYITRELTRLGLRPAGDNGTFLYKVPLERQRMTGTVSVSSPAGSSSLGPDEILPVSGEGGLPAAATLSGSGPLIYGGYMFDASLGPAELRAEQVRGAR
jgi:hypothetical protein